MAGSPAHEPGRTTASITPLLSGSFDALGLNIVEADLPLANSNKYTSPGVEEQSPLSHVLSAYSAMTWRRIRRRSRRQCSAHPIQDRRLNAAGEPRGMEEANQ